MGHSPPVRILLAASVVWASLATAPVAGSSCSSWSTRFEKHLDGVCVCNATQCDEITDTYETLSHDQVAVFRTSKGGDRLALTTLTLERDDKDDAADTGSHDGKANRLEFVIDTETVYQELVGFGGAFTDATAINVYKMEAALQTRILDAYFSASGLEYTLGRVPIGSTDFSESVYSYNPVVDDLEMTHFSIDVDKSNATHKLEFLQRALATSRRNISLFASSWAPPPWMTKENKTENCHIKGDAGGEYWQALALYYSKFLDAYKAEGVSFWAMTTQNEPIQQALAVNEWQSLRFTSEEEREFVKKNLGPMLKDNHPELKLIIFDDQKDEMMQWNASFADPEANQYVDGIGVHWYKNLDFIGDTGGNFGNLADFHALHPEVFILATEACGGYLLDGLGTGAGTKLLEPDVIWQRGENYARDIINDLANFAVGWTDWNLVLDSTGGPNWAMNLVDAPILVDEENGREFYKQPIFYVMGHFAKFLPRGSTRVAMTASSATEAVLGKVDRVAFVTPAQQLVVVLSNRGEDAISLTLHDDKQHRTVRVELEGNAMATILFAIEDAVSGSSSAPALSAGTSSIHGQYATMHMEFWITTVVAILVAARHL